MVYIPSIAEEPVKPHQRCVPMNTVLLLLGKLFRMGATGDLSGRRGAG